MRNGLPKPNVQHPDRPDGPDMNETSVSKILAQTEKLSPDNLDHYQRRSLLRLLDFAHTRVPFYKSALKPLFRNGYGPDLSKWDQIPIISRAECQENQQLMLAEEHHAEAGEAVDSLTSGSTGEPLTIRYSQATGTLAAYLARRVQRWNALDFDQRLAQIVSLKRDEAQLPDGDRQESWNEWGSGDQVRLNLKGTTLAQQFDWVDRQRATYLKSFPTVARALLEEADRRNTDLGFQAILTIGEVVDEEMRPPLAPAHWPRIIDTYAAMEVGPISAQCRLGRYHVHSENVVLEILDDQGEPVAPGEIGQVVVTGLYNFAMPFIRYSLGDYAQADGGRCSCGLPHPTIGKILGRQRNLFRFPGGRTIWPSVQAHLIREFMPYRFRQVVQTGPLEVEFRYTPESEDQHEDLDALKDHLRTWLDPRIEVRAIRVPMPDRSNGEKILDFVCQI